MGLLGAIEAGGQNLSWLWRMKNFNIVERTAFPTPDGDKTLDQVIVF